jgi:GAF domain-containing protein
LISKSRLADVFVEVADTLVSDFDLIEFVYRFADHVAAISTADAVGVVLADTDGILRFMAASNAAGKALELFQLQDHEGPCRDAFDGGRPVVNRDLGHADDLWPRFAPQARAAGFESVHAFPLRLRGDVIGALNLFGRRKMTFDEVDTGIVQALADVATIAILQERSLSNVSALAAQLESALSSRIVIEQAKGALSKSAGVSVEEAFVLLRQRAPRSRTRLVDVAQAVLDE